MIDMRRREFITLLGGAAAAWPLAARAQQPERMRRIGVLSGLVESDPETPLRVVAFRQALGKLGWSEGRDLVIDFRWGAGDPSLMRVHAKELIGATPDVVVAESTPAAAALRQETSAVSIVFLQVGNPVGSGFVASLAHPGGNLTGFTNFEPTMGGKWLELLKEIAPPVTRAIAIFNPDTHSGQYWQTMEVAAPSLAVEFKRAPVRDVAGIESAVADLAREPNGGVVVMPDAFTLTHLSSSSLRSQPAIACRRFIRSAFSPSTAGCCPTELITLTFIGARHLTSIASSGARSRPTCRFRHRRNSS
jgi:ABC-type uncharacterized transport system substrate-binding protein